MGGLNQDAAVFAGFCALLWPRMLFFNLEWVLNTLEHSPINLRQYFNFKVCPSVCLSINGSVLIPPPHGFLMTFFLKKSNFLNNSKYNPQNWSWWDVLNIKKEKLIGGVKFKLCSSGKGKPPNRPRLDSTPPPHGLFRVKRFRCFVAENLESVG